MNYIGNYATWIDPTWTNLLLETPGQARPHDGPLINEIENNLYSNFVNAGYNLNTVLWWIYEKKDLDIEVIPPWTTNNVHWWFTKMYPGQFMPAYRSPYARSTMQTILGLTSRLYCRTYLHNQ